MIDARGQRCPWPAIRLAKALREAGEAGPVTILADDPKAERELGAVAEERGWALLRTGDDRFEARPPA